MKKVVMVNNGKHVRIDPHFCPHEHTVFIQTGHRYTIAGEATDDLESYEQCLDCGWVLRGDRTWGPNFNIESDKIPY